MMINIQIWSLKIVVFILLIAPLLTQGANILAVMPSVWKSHYLFGLSILKQLVEHKNHTVTLISPYEMSQVEQALIAKDKFNEIKVEGLLDNWQEMGLSFNIEQMHDKSVMEHFTRLMYATTSNTDSLLQNIKVKELLQTNVKFDLLVVDLFLNDALLGLSFYYQIPTVVLSPSGSNTWLNQRFGNPQNAALDPSNFLPFNNYMTFWQRCINTLMAMFEKLTYSFFHMISQQAVYTKHFETLCQLASWCTELPHHKELTENLSLALINTHPVLQYPRAFLPNMLSVAGLHLKLTENDLQLPNHLKEFIEEATQGVIYLSFGANIYDLSWEKLELFLDVFETLPGMRFIIKYDNPQTLTNTLNVSQKIMLQEWWPQQEILAHPNVKVFITSGGFMSITEALYYEKSILTIPITPEQYVLGEKLTQQNAAYKINYQDLSYDQLLYALQFLLTDKTQEIAVKHLKQQLIQNLDNMTPIQRTLNAIELTLNTQGLDYLKPHSHHLNFWNSILIDVMFLLILALILIVAIPFLVTSCILKKSYQNHTKLSQLQQQQQQQQQQNHHYHCKVNEFLNTTNSNSTSTTPLRSCSNHKNLPRQNSQDIVTQERRNSNHSDIQDKRKRLSSNSSSCCNCSQSSNSSSAPTTPLNKKESLLNEQITSLDFHDKNV